MQSLNMSYRGKIKILFKTASFLFILFLIFFFPQIVLAQSDLGLNYAEGTGLGTADVRTVIARAIKIILGFLGIIATLLIIYGGFLYMTAGGNEEATAKAKKTLIRAVIGLAIVLSAYAIAQFVISKLGQATGLVSPGINGTSEPPPSLPPGAFLVQGIQPQGDLPIRNVVVTVVFNKEVDNLSVSEDNFLIKKDSDKNVVKGVIRIFSNKIEFTPAADCPGSTAAKCFDQNTAYSVEVLNTIKSKDNKTLLCGGLAPLCAASFKTGSLIDLTAPTVKIIAPLPGGVSVDSSVVITAKSNDDAGIAYLDFFLVDELNKNVRLDTKVNTSKPPSKDYIASTVWDTKGLKLLSKYNLKAEAKDINDHKTVSESVEVIIRPAYCFNTVKDGDETDIDCGGSCGACSGNPCQKNTDCASGSCLNGVCVNIPVIYQVTPSDGAIGNFITISGRYFGKYNVKESKVIFLGADKKLNTSDDKEAPLACSLTSSWSSSQIIIEVPQGVSNGPLLVQEGESGKKYTDKTDDMERGPLIQDFTVNNISRPGLCFVIPSSGMYQEMINVKGKGLGSYKSGESNLSFGGIPALVQGSNWLPSSIIAPVPNVSPSLVSLTAVSGKETSNPLGFLVKPSSNLPQITKFEPIFGPPGTYLTISGSNFGSKTGVVSFKNTVSGKTVLADINFPPVCGQNKWWSNDSIIVKVPNINLEEDYLITLLTFDKVQIDSGHLKAPLSNVFKTTKGAPAPGLCLLNPDNGPENTSISLAGEYFSNTKGAVLFYSQKEAVITDKDWQDNQIASVVPQGAISGPVKVYSKDQGVCAPKCSVSQPCSVGASCLNGACYYPCKSDKECSGGRTCLQNICGKKCTLDKDCSHSESCVKNSSNTLNFKVAQCAPDSCPAGQSCCSDKTCRASCPGLTLGKSAYAWFFSTGSIPTLPQVAENKDCLNIKNPSLSQPQSPSPWKDSTNACINTAIAVYFNTDMQDSALTGKNIQVKKCNTGSVFDSLSCSTNLLCNLVIINKGTNNEGIKCLPSSLSADTWYQVTLKGDQIKSEKGLSLDGDYDNKEGGDYLWQFRVDKSAADCAISHLEVTPLSATIKIKDEIKTYSADPTAANCNPLTSCPNPLWQSKFKDSSDASAAAPKISQDDIKCQADFQGKQETKNDPAQIIASLSGKTDFGLLSINFEKPRIKNKWPDCQEACPNGQVGVQFSAEMDSSSTNISKNNFKLYQWTCGNGVLDKNEDCDPPDGVYCKKSGVSDQGCVNLGTKKCAGDVTINCCGNGKKELGEDCDGRPFPFNCDANTCLYLNESLRSRGTLALDNLYVNPVAVIKDKETLVSFGNDILQPNTFYRAVVTEQVSAKSGLTLDSLDFNYDYGQTGKNNSYSWTFKTKNDSSLCKIDRVLVIPQSQRLGVIGAKQNYSALAYSASDKCDSQGQFLNSSLYNWSWKSEKETVASVTNDDKYPGCGNKAVETGEDCDPPGPGCDTECLHSGSKTTPALKYCSNDYGKSCSSDTDCNKVNPLAKCLTAKCGNKIIDAGEDCDDGNAASGDGCNDGCLNEGSLTGIAVCGNGLLEKGEDCDDGNKNAYDYCSSFCLNEGRTEAKGGILYTDGKIDPYQTATALGILPEDNEKGESATKILASADNKSNSGDLTIVCGYSLGQTCPLPDHKVGADGCCRPQPKASYVGAKGLFGAVNVCLNPLITIAFDQIMDDFSLSSNAFLASDYTSEKKCPVGTSAIEWAVSGKKNTYNNIFQKAYHRLSNFFNKIWNKKRAQAGTSSFWCAVDSKAVSETVEDDKKIQTTSLSFSLKAPLDKNRKHRVIILGDNLKTLDKVEGAVDKYGVGIKTNSSFLDSDSNEYQIYQGEFTTGSNLCELNQVVLTPSTYQFLRKGEAYFKAQAIDKNKNPLSSIKGVYEWSWAWNSSDSTVVKEKNPPSKIEINTNESKRLFTDMNKNGQAVLSAAATLTAVKGLSAGVAKTAQGDTFTGASVITVFFCENPWPKTFPLQDAEGNNDGLKKLKGWTNFETYYCRDTGKSAYTSDDLSDFQVNSVDHPPTIRGKDPIVKEFIFKDKKSSDAIGLRVMKNSKNLSVLDWYKAQGFLGNPQAVSGGVDGYEAIQEGRTVYVSAANLGNPSLYANIYILSYNEGASADTINIYNQMLKNLRFNVNLLNHKVCNKSTDKLCTQDGDCPKNELCQAPKDKLVRDIKRVGDFNTIARLLDNYKTSKGYYPRLEAGTYLKSLSVSAWPSWQSTLGNALGSALPVDPLNKFSACLESYDPQTCWNIKEGKYHCPLNSRIYQYYNPGKEYELSSDFEFGVCEKNFRKTCLIDSNCSKTEGLCMNWQYLSSLWSLDTRFKVANTCAGNIYAGTGVCGDKIKDTQGNCLNNKCTLTGLSCKSNSDCLGEQCELGDKKISPCDLLGSVKGTKIDTCDPQTCQWKTGACSLNCGNGIVDAGEDCDQGEKGGRIFKGGTSSSDQYYCTSSCKWSGGYCGDGQIQAQYGERCDDKENNTAYSSITYDSVLGKNRSYCKPDCSNYAPYCGDEQTQAEEECDLGQGGDIQQSCVTSDKKTGIQSRNCSGLCKLGSWSSCVVSQAVCGNGKQEAGEECDDGNANNIDSCIVGICSSTQNQGCAQDIDCPKGEKCVTKSGLCWKKVCSLDVSTTCASDSDCSPSSGKCLEQNFHQGCATSKDCNLGEICKQILLDGYKFQGGCKTAKCGDNFIKKGSEDCDTGDKILGGANDTQCSAPYGSACYFCQTSSCRLGYADGPYCGDGVIDTKHEECDDGKNNKLTGKVLTTYGTTDTFCHAKTCKKTTTFAPYCGDKIVQKIDPSKLSSYDPEQCEGPGKGTGFSDQYDCGTAGTEACIWKGGYCGDQIIQSSYGEQCDSDKLNNMTCSTMGWGNAGALSCDKTCKFYSGGCSKGSLKPGEMKIELLWVGESWPVGYKTINPSLPRGSLDLDIFLKISVGAGEKTIYSGDTGSLFESPYAYLALEDKKANAGEDINKDGIPDGLEILIITTQPSGTYFPGLYKLYIHDVLYGSPFSQQGINGCSFSYAKVRVYTYDITSPHNAKLEKEIFPPACPSSDQIGKPYWHVLDVDGKTGVIYEYPESDPKNKGKIFVANP